ncbi:MAG TPA: hypothetical protein VFZ34_12590 [Blastocatellia bacterium]|nr:hypothetical protein [Blastocatellia bacterium]
MTSQTLSCTIILFVILLIAFACRTAPPITQSTPPASLQPSATVTSTMPQQSEDEGKSAEDFFMKEDQLSYQGYEVFKRQKKVNFKYSGGERYPIDVASVVVKKARKTVAIFDGDEFTVDSFADLGLAPLLGKEEKQLLVALTVRRGGRQWIVDLSPNYREIFDTGEWGVGREGADLGFIDIDKDGIWEIESGDFWYMVFDQISMSETPVADVIFKYDTKARKYVPANHLFPEYSLHGIDEASTSLPVNEGYGYLGRRVDVLLTYLYAGKEIEGWAFFDRTYKASDKAQIKARIRNVLKDSAVYKYIRKQRGN